MSPDARELFVVGSPRSGTTLLASVLNQLPEVWIGEETGFVPRLYRPGFESLHEFDDQQLAALVEAVNSYLTMGHWTRLASVAGARRFWSESGTTGYAGLVRYVWSLDEAPEGSRPAVAGDQTPNYVLALPLLEQMFPDAFYVHVVRDPRDVVASILPLPFGAQSVGGAASGWKPGLGREIRESPGRGRLCSHSSLASMRLPLLSVPTMRSPPASRSGKSKENTGFSLTGS